ncbi:MAG TPA: carbamoyltransferase [Methylomirabilota bacterium]|nr:carbamoyltransferase [Methylomirabilota bacterium]
MKPTGVSGTKILGISAFYHDSAAALIVDGEIVAAAQEERFTRKKHDHHFPTNAIEFCLREAGLSVVDLDYVGFYDKPLAKFERLIETYATFAPASFASYLKALPLWLKSKLHLQREMDRAFGGGYRGRYIFADHHESHAASAFFPSPFEEAAILTLDGVGEWSTTTMGSGRNNRLKLTHEIRFPHSLGLLYSAFTYYTGFRVNSGEYKVMGLAPYGEPRFKELILKHLIHVREDGSFWMDQSYFNYCGGMTMTTEKFHRLFGDPPRNPESLVTQREMDLAASVQAVCEGVMLKCARHLHKLTGMKNLVMAGGVALNCVGNGKILREGPFENIWIQPAAGDAGGALGVAQLIWHHVLSQPRTVNSVDSLRGSLLGPRYADDDIRAFLDSTGARYHAFANEDELLARVTDLLAQEKVVGWVQDRMEFGPRALGARSIIGDPRSTKMQQVMNLKIKFRESFRPFAPSVLREKNTEYFDMPERADSPYMLIVAPVREDKRTSDCAEKMKGLTGIEKLNVPRSVVPSITHVDFSARVQTVTPDANGRYYRLIKEFHERTGCPILVNTSFNIRGEPIVCTPQDAWRCFMGTDMDALVLENTLLLKEEQNSAKTFDAEAYKASFKLD